MKKIKILLVAINGYGRNYSDVLLDNHDKGIYEIVGIVDPFAKLHPRIDEFIGLNIPILDNITDFFNEHKADLTIISSPIHLHEAQSVHALKNNSHVLCEKPIAGSMDQALRMVNAATKYDKMLSIGYQLSFSESNNRLKKDLLDGKYGKIEYAKTMVLWPRSLDYYNRNSWAGKLKAKDGSFIRDSVLQNATAHYLQNLLYLTGDSANNISTIKDFKYKAYRANDIETFDTVVLDMKTENDIRLFVVLSHPVDSQVDPIMEIKAELGYIYLYEDGELQGKTNDGATIDYGNVKNEALLNGVEFNTKIVSMFNAINRSAECQSPAITTLEHLKCVEAIEIIKKNDCIDRVSHNTMELVFVPGLADRLKKSYQNMSFEGLE